MEGMNKEGEMTRADVREILGRQCEGIAEESAKLASRLDVYDKSPADVELYNILHWIVRSGIGALESLAMLDLEPEKRIPQPPLAGKTEGAE